MLRALNLFLAAWIIVSPLVTPTASAQVSDDKLIERLDRLAAERGISRSALITDLASKGLGEPLGPGVRPEARQAMERIRNYSPGKGPPRIPPP